MDIKDFREKRTQLEADICAATQKLVNDFEGETSVQVTDIKIRLFCLGMVGEPNRSMISEAKVDVDI